MSQSLSKLLVHLVFSTKNRECCLNDAIRSELHAYAGGIVANMDGTLLRADSVADHIYLLVVHPRTHSTAELIQEIKTGISKWLKTKQSSFVTFHWQSGYGAFSISPSHRIGLET